MKKYIKNFIIDNHLQRKIPLVSPPEDNPDQPEDELEVRPTKADEEAQAKHSTDLTDISTNHEEESSTLPKITQIDLTGSEPLPQLTSPSSPKSHRKLSVTFSTSSPLTPKKPEEAISSKKRNTKISARKIISKPSS